MAQILIKGESVYKCDVCMRKIRVLTSREGIDVVNRCTITYGCKGRFHRVKNAEEANATPAFPTEVAGVKDWFQRRVEYTHIQPIKSATWVIKHNLANKPIVYAYVARQCMASATIGQASIPANTLWYKSASGVDPDNTLAPSAAGLYRYDGTRWVRPTDVIPVGLRGTTVFEYQELVQPVKVETVDQHTTHVTFSTPQYGVAQCIALQSQNSANPIRAIESVSEAAFRLSNKGEITIATLNPSPYITVALNFKSSVVAGGINVSFGSVDNTASVNSPWASVDRIYVNGKAYTVRSFDLGHLPPMPAVMASGNVDPTRARFTFENFSSNINENLILLGNAPYYTVDRIYDRYVDIATLNRFAPEIYFNDGEIYVATKAIKSVYPAISTLDYADVSTIVEDSRDTTTSAAPYWINLLGSSARDYNYQAAVDVYGNVYTIGYTLSTNSSFVAKYNSAGELLRQWQMNNTPGSYKQDIATDSFGNIYTVGFTLDPSTNLYSALVVKYNSSGTIVWQRAMQGVNATRGCGIMINNSGNAVVSGYTNSGTSGWDFLVAVFSSTGDIEWQQTLGSVNDEINYSLAIDSSNNIVVVGYAYGGSLTSYDIIVAKFNQAGNLVWQRSFDANTAAAYAYDVCCDTSGNIYVAGAINDNIGVFKLSSSGDWLWGKEMDGAAQDGATGVAVDPQGSVYVTGFTGSVGAGGSDGIIVKLNNAGLLTWIRTFGSTVGNMTADSFGQITVDGIGNMFITGSTSNTIEGSGMTDTLLVKLPTDGTRSGVYNSFIYQPVLMSIIDTTLTESVSSLDVAISALDVTPATLVQSDSYMTAKFIPIN